jgi:hypothetical protein
MKTRNELRMKRFQFLGYRRDGRTKLSGRPRGAGLHRKAGHDPLLVFNMSVFNFAGGPDHPFNPLKIHETAAR